MSIFGAWLESRSRRQHIGLDTFSRALLADYWDHCSDVRGAAASTANRRVNHVHQLWEWCYDHDTIGAETPRPRRIDLPSPEAAATRAPTWAQMDAVIDAVGLEHWRRYLMVLRCTGLRTSQAMQLRWEDVDFDAGTLLIRPELGKSRSERRGRVVPLAPVLLREMSTWGPRQGWLVDWPGDTGQRDPARSTLRRAWERAGVPREIWATQPNHAMRKGYISGLRLLGAAADAVEFLVGHDMGIRGTYTDPWALPLTDAVARVPGCVPGCVPTVSRGGIGLSGTSVRP